nr:hypothetical protein [Tanacetum cinerariifolium]
MANIEFSNEFVGNYAVFQPYGISDHSPTVLRTPLQQKFYPKPFKFANVVTSFPRFKEDLCDEEAVYVRAFTEAFIMEERFLKQKAKIEWLKVGDSNSAYFYKSVRGHASRNRIDVVTDYGGLVMGDGVPVAFISHYETFLGQPGITFLFDANNLFLNKLTSNQALDMIKHVTSQEVKEAIFFMGRRISDNILLTQELMHNYHLDRGPTRCAFKIDIQKAYDAVDWNFLKEVLLAFGFHARMVNWIMECVTTTSFSLSINGTLHGYFKGKRGLRQGRSEIPRGLDIITNVLIWRSSIFVLRMIYSFLLMVICSAKVIMEAMEEFKNVSGLTPSLPKSTAYFGNVLNHTKLSILQILLFDEGRLPVKYLGVPLVSSWLVFSDCEGLIEFEIALMIGRTNRSRGWKASTCSIGSWLYACILGFGSYPS